LLRTRSWRTFLLDLLELGSQFQSPTLSLTQANNLSLIGVKSALALALQTLPALPALCVLRRPG
jgi:hypothetical protein